MTGNNVWVGSCTASPTKVPQERPEHHQGHEQTARATAGQRRRGGQRAQSQDQGHRPQRVGSLHHPGDDLIARPERQGAAIDPVAHDRQAGHGGAPDRHRHQRIRSSLPSLGPTDHRREPSGPRAGQQPKGGASGQLLNPNGGDPLIGNKGVVPLMATKTVYPVAAATKAGNSMRLAVSS